MTVTADAKKRVVLPPASPGQCFKVQILEQGKYVLTRLDPFQSRPAKVRFVKRDGFTVGVLGHPIDPAALKQALADLSY